MMTAKKKPPLMLQTRDLEILQCVFEHRFLTRSIILPLFGAVAAEDDTNLDRRLRKLTAAGYLERLKRPDRRTEFVYALTKAGADLLSTQQPRLPFLVTDWSEKNRTAKTLFIDHTLMVARWYAAFVVATRELPSVTVEHYERESRPRGQHALVRRFRQGRSGEEKLAAPDAFLLLGGDGIHPGAHFLEADQSTMALDRMADKFEVYALMYREKRHPDLFGVPSFRVCVVTKSQQRASNLLELLLEGTDIRPEERKLFWFTPEVTYRDCLSNVLAAVWRSGDRPHELRALVGSPLPRRAAANEKSPSVKEEP